ncbi:MAG: zinc-dependent peptidase [Immundisolibacterales bacterium]|nr:zinc-dependent peptidase [Immundisolibacterales bacterium]
MWRRRRERAIEEADWSAVLDAVPILDPLDDDERARLRGLAERFIATRSIEPMLDQRLGPVDAAVIAAQACLPVLALGLDAYASWRTVVVYPAGFVARGQEVDEAGVEHEWEEERSGESWSGGPVVLSFEDVEASGQGEGYNVVIHEVAHKLDMLDGDANGRPPLHRGMDAVAWSRDFGAAFDDLNRCIDAGEVPPLDEYAAEEPGEFFAVASECFFETPAELDSAFPRVYGHLRDFYRQDPLARLARRGGERGRSVRACPVPGKAACE